MLGIWPLGPALSGVTSYIAILIISLKNWILIPTKMFNNI